VYAIDIILILNLADNLQINMKVWGTTGNSRSKKISVVAAYTGHELTFTEVDESNRKDFQKKAPNGFLPALEVPEGPIAISESNAIIRYLARNSKGAKLYGKSAFEEAQINQWLDWGLTELEPAVLAFAAPYLGYAPFVKESDAKAAEETKTWLTILNNHLNNRKFLVGDEITIADLSLASALNFSFQFLYDEKKRNQYSNITKWFQEVTSQEKWRSVYGKTTLCKVALKPYTGPLE